MAFRNRPLTTPDQIADLYEQVRNLQERLRSRVVGSLSLGSVIIDSGVDAVEMVDPDDVSLGWAAVDTGTEPVIGRLELLDAGGAVVGWVPVFDAT